MVRLFRALLAVALGSTIVAACTSGPATGGDAEARRCAVRADTNTGSPLHAALRCAAGFAARNGYTDYKWSRQYERLVALPLSRRERRIAAPGWPLGDPRRACPPGRAGNIAGRYLVIFEYAGYLGRPAPAALGQGIGRAVSMDTTFADLRLEPADYSIRPEARCVPIGGR
jgi:hypothetical protein